MRSAGSAGRTNEDDSRRVAIDSAAFIVGSVSVGLVLIATLLYTWVIAVRDAESCSEAIGSIPLRNASIQVCKSLTWFFGTAMATVVVVGGLSIRDFVRNTHLPRIPLYMVLIAASSTVYLLPSRNMGF